MQSSLVTNLVQLRTTTHQNGALFLDRDGVLNVDKGYVYRWQDFDWIPGAKKLIRAFNDAEWPVIVVSNQSGVARGYYKESDILKLNQSINLHLSEAGARIDAFFHCPFHKDGVVDQYRVADHPDRKPNPGMLLRAAAENDIALNNAILVGDNLTDVEAAERVGAVGFLFGEANLFDFVSARVAQLCSRSSHQ